MKASCHRFPHKWVTVASFALFVWPGSPAAQAQSASPPALPPPTTTATKRTAATRTLTSSPLILTGERTLVLDPACNACEGAGLTLLLQYPGSSTAKAAAIRIQLHALHLVGDSKAEDPAAGVETTIRPAAPNDSLPAEIKPGESVPIYVRVKGILPAGKWKTSVYNGETSLGDVSVVVPDVSFRIILDPASQDDGKTKSLGVTRGEKAKLIVKSEDNVGYWFNWTFSVNNKKIPMAFPPGEPDPRPFRSMPQDRNASMAEPSKIPAGGQALIEIDPQPSWFEESGKPVCSWLTAWLEDINVPCFWRAIFKDQEAEGLLTIRLASPECKNDAGAAVRFLRVPVVLNSYGANRKSFWSNCAILLLLLAGALFSLYINYRFPDEQIRSDLKEQLAASGRAISDLSMTLGSRLRVLVGMENRLLASKLRRLKWYSTEFEKERSEIAVSAERLAKRVDQLRRIGRLRDDYELLTSNEVPPTLLQKLEESFELLSRMIDDFRVSDSDLQAAEVKVKELQLAIVNWKQPDTVTVGELFDLLKSLNDDLQGRRRSGAPQVPPGNAQPAVGKLAASPTLDQLLTDPEQGRLYPSVGRLVEELLEPIASAAQINTANYYRKGLAAYRGDTLRRYIFLCDTRNPNDNPELLSRREELMSLLATESWYGQRKARRLVWEMSEGIYEDDIRKQIEEKRVEITLDRNVLRAFEPALFDIRFTVPKYDTCSAREEWSATINFGHGPFETECGGGNFLEEIGWRVAHYFPQKGWYSLTATFRDVEARSPISPAGQVSKRIFVGPEGDEAAITGSWIGTRRLWQKYSKWFQLNGNAILRVVLALIPAIIGLVAGAKEQLLKMDLFLALSGVFMLGFTSDQVKNLLSQKTKP